MKIRFKPYGRLFEVRYGQREMMKNGEISQEYIDSLEHEPQRYYIDDQEVSQADFEVSFKNEG